MNQRRVIERCISDCAKAPDYRGRWRQGRKLAEHLLATGSTPTIAEATARAAVAVGAVIAGAARRAHADELAALDAAAIGEAE